MSRGKLYIVATPIGNLGDITFRALETLKSVELIAAEDTRVTRKLLTHYTISKKLVSFHEHSSKEKLDSIIQVLEGGMDVALVSDAGTPVISDPGLKVVQACVAQGIPVESIPGANAAVVAVTLCGWDCANFVFAGFLPAKATARRKELVRFGLAGMPVVLYESPARVVKTLEDICEVYGGDTSVSAARELTKLHEEVLRGTASDVLGQLAARESIKGEFVLIFTPCLQAQEATDAEIQTMLTRELQAGKTKKEAVTLVTAALSCPKNRVYKLLLELCK